MRPLPSPQRISEPQDFGQLEAGRLAAICRAWLRCSGDLVLLLSADGHVSHAVQSRAVQSQAGHAALREDFLTQLAGAAWRMLWPKAYRPLAAKALTEAAAGGAGHFQAPLACNEGELRWFDVAVAPISNVNGAIAEPDAEWLAVLRDITTQKADDERAAQSRRLEAIGRLAGGVAHDFNNLLTVILSSTESVLDGSAPDETRRLAETSLQAAERGAELIRRLLAFVRPAARAPTHAASADAGAAVEAAARLLQRTLPEQIAFKASAPAGLLYCRADRSELENALLNLCANARDAMPNGGRLALSAELRTLDRTTAHGLGVKPGDYAAFAVEDDGVGMSADTAARAAEPFFSTKADTGGTGLGLSAANGMAVAAGGILSIRTRLGHGSRVELLIPRVRAAAQGQLKLVPALEAAPACDVLLVEDHPAVREETARLLRDMGCRVTASGDAESAMDTLAGGAPIDLMITDLSLPYGLDGRALAEVARAIRPDLRILFTSGYGPQGAEDAPDFLPKPFGRAALAAAIHRQFVHPAPNSSLRARSK